MLSVRSQPKHASFLLLTTLFVLSTVCDVYAQPADGLVPRFAPETGGLVQERATRPRAFLDVRGRKAGVFGHEKAPLEIWTYPFKIAGDFELSFQTGDDPAVSGPEIMTHVTVRPEATTVTYTHDTFTVRQTLFAPVDAMGVVMLLDVESARPLDVIVAFQPDLRLMGSDDPMKSTLRWDAERHAYTIDEAKHRFAGMIGAPGARDASDTSAPSTARFVVHTTPAVTRDYLIPVVAAGSVTGRDDARATYEHLLGTVETGYRDSARYYRTRLDETVQLRTPDERLNDAFSWAKIGLEKSLATDPENGGTFMAGFRADARGKQSAFTRLSSRDALWNTLALIAAGSLDAARSILDTLEKSQRADGLIPREIAPGFSPADRTGADATLLFIIARTALWHATGDLDALRNHWPAIRKAYAFSAATDTDGNDLVENTNDGAEGGAPPAREAIDLEGLWVEAARNVTEIARVLDDAEMTNTAGAAGEAARKAIETTFWRDDAGYYADAAGSTENTALFAVPMIWGLLTDARAQRAIDTLGGDTAPPLFTGWTSLGAYRYDRAHVGYRALRSNVFATTGAEAMIVLPTVRGLLGLDVGTNGSVLRFAPQLPADWDSLSVKNVAVGGARYDFSYERFDGGVKIIVDQHGSGGIEKFELAPAFPLDAVVQTIRNNRYTAVFNLLEKGDEQRAIIKVDAAPRLEATFNAKAGTGVYVPTEASGAGSTEDGIRLLRTQAQPDGLHLLVEGRGGHTYTLYARTPYLLAGVDGVTVTREEGQDTKLAIRFDGPEDAYVRRDLLLPLRKQQ